MKCPVCGVWTVVKDTRGGRRRRECANEHRFTTEEVVIPEEVIKQRQRDHLKAISERVVALRQSKRQDSSTVAQATPNQR